jgi:hypothetical protein
MSEGYFCTYECPDCGVIHEHVPVECNQEEVDLVQEKKIEDELQKQYFDRE